MDLERRIAELAPARRALLAERLRALDVAGFDAADADPADDKRLVAYLVARPGRRPGAGELRAFVTLPALPRTGSGKIARRALPAPEHAHHSVAAASPEAARLTALWAEVLGLDEVGVDDDFFELGGDSIVVLKLCARARELGIPLAPQEVYGHPTIAELLAAGGGEG
jgi:aryl carrier-like protein